MKEAVVRHSESVQIAWRIAELEAAALGHSELEPEHLFLALMKLVELDMDRILSEGSILSAKQIQLELDRVATLAKCLHAAGIDTTYIRRWLRRALQRGEGKVPPGQKVRRSAAARSVFEFSEGLAEEDRSQNLEPLHLLRGIIDAECEPVVRALHHVGVDPEILSAMARDPGSPGDDQPVRSADEKTAPVPGSSRPGKQAAHGAGMRSGGSLKGANVNWRDLTELAKKGRLAPVIGRQAEMRSLVQSLLRSRKNSVILVGDAGVGKTGIVEGLAQRIADGAVPDEFANKRIVEISMGSLIAGTTLRGEMEERLQGLVEAASHDSRVILFIDEIHLLVGAGRAAGSAMDAANLLKPALARGEIRVIGATTTPEYRRCIESDPALARRFELIEVEEPSRTDALAILRGLKQTIEDHHGVVIEDDALEAAVELTVRYLPSLRLPDKAIDVLDQACSQARMQSLSGDFRAQFREGLRIGRKEVAAAVAHRAKVPVGEVSSDDAAKLLDLEAALSKRIKGQPQAIRMVSQAVRLARSPLKAPDKPGAVFLFAGPSGTGKTEMAKALTSILFGDESRLIRIDMSEFMEAHSVSKLIGAPPGFIGHESGGQLTERIRTQPYSVVLLDEVEKAHPKILDIFLQAFDHGFITDSHGVRCDFRDALFILTSNLGAPDSSPGKIGFGATSAPPESRSDISHPVQEAASRFFRREFLGRLTEIIVFEALDMNVAGQILETILERINQRLETRGLRIELSPEAEALLLEKGFSKAYGARDLERIVDRTVSKPAADFILANNPPPGSCLLCEAVDGKLSFKGSS